MLNPAAITERISRYTSLYTDTITNMPVAIIMPHSACNCRCIMCDIWKGNRNLKQLSTADIEVLLISLDKLKTKQVLLSGGEALMHPLFFEYTTLLRSHGMFVSLLSTGMTVEKHAGRLVESVNEIILSLDGDEELHDGIRNVPGAFEKIRQGVKSLKQHDPAFSVSARTVIHRLNFRSWKNIITSAAHLGFDRISFLPADTSSTAFNREVAWDADRVADLCLHEDELDELFTIIEDIIAAHGKSGFIAESPAKLRQIGQYYAAQHALALYPARMCNAPWVSVVVEADGTVKPCFFHSSIGNIHHDPLDRIVNSPAAKRFRKQLDMSADETCKRCVCSLYLHPGTKIATS